MRTTQWSLSVLGVAAAIEAVTGLVMILFPQVLIRLLLDADVAGAGIVVGRVRRHCIDLAWSWLLDGSTRCKLQLAYLGHAHL